ncbi:MAG TPA: YetF domain-containing protein [Albitalea sp.]
MDWSSLFEFNVPVIELVARGTLMYWLLFSIFRFVIRRDIGAVGIGDVLILVLVADAAQNAMSGGYDTVAEGAVLVGTLIGWNVLLDWAAFRFEWLRRLAEPRPLLLVHRGKVLHANLRRQFVTLDELKEQLRQHGVVNFADVRSAFMESDGRFSVIRYQPDDAGDASAASDKRGGVR